MLLRFSIRCDVIRLRFKELAFRGSQNPCAKLTSIQRSTTFDPKSLCVKVGDPNALENPCNEEPTNRSNHEDSRRNRKASRRAIPERV